VPILLLGLNHKTASVELREKLSLSATALQTAYADLRIQWEAQQASEPIINELAILSTCNRLEIYAFAENAENGIRFLKDYLSNLQNVPLSELRGHLYSYIGDDATEHLMRVACGLDSMILGETQILGQVTQAYEVAHDAGMTGAILSHLFAQAIHTGKRARTETAISRYTTSVSHAAALLLIEKLTSRGKARILILGAGEMASLAAQALKRFDSEMSFINRSYERAEAMAKAFGGKAYRWLDIHDALNWADGVISATGAAHSVISRQLVEAVLHERENRPLVFVDIAVPRDVENSVRELSGVQVYDIDDLQAVVDSNIELRKAAIPEVETIIQVEMARFAEWYHSRQVSPVIKSLRDWAQTIADDELNQTLNRLSDADERTREIVSRLAHRLVNRLLHEPTSRLKIQANEGNGYAYAHAVRELFALNTLDVVECQDKTACGFAEQSHSNPECNLQCIVNP
jgi:glutamyl-tRNA reductase